MEERRHSQAKENHLHYASSLARSASNTERICRLWRGEIATAADSPVGCNLRWDPIPIQSVCTCGIATQLADVADVRIMRVKEVRQENVRMNELHPWLFQSDNAQAVSIITQVAR
jgi:hypothetical protein